MRYLLLLCLPLVAQVQTPLTVYQSSGTATGEIRLQERRTNGSNHVGLAAPQSVAADLVWTLPATDGTNGQSLVTNGSGVLSWGSGASQWTTSGTSIYYNGGSVGIGENAPSKGLLSVYGSIGFAHTPANFKAVARFRSEANSAILLGTTTANPSGWTRGISWAFETEDIRFARFKDDETANPIDDLYIGANGRVGIGTTSPTEPLTVSGNLDIIASGALEIGGTTVINSSRAANFTGLTIATGAVNGYVLQTNGSGVASWAAVPSCANCVVNGGNTLGGLTIGTNDAQPLSFETDNTARWRVTAAGMLQPGAADTYDIGDLSTARVRSIYTKYLDTAYLSSTGDYVKSRLFRFADTGTTSGYWDVWANANIPGTSNFTVKDNSGSRLFVAWRGFGGTPVNYTYWYGDFLPALRNTVDGDGVTDVLYPSLGSSSYRWGTAYLSQLDVAGTVNSDLVPFGTGTYDLGESGYRWRKLWGVDADLSGLLQMAGTTVINSSRNVVGINSFSQNITFSANSTYNIGSSTVYPLNVWANYIEPKTELVMGVGTAFRGDFIPANNNFYAIGNTSFRLSTVVTTNANISGTITAPNGNTGWSGTRTIRDSAGTGTCTLIFSAGILTGGTC